VLLARGRPAPTPRPPAAAPYDEATSEEAHVTPAPLDELRKEMKKAASDDDDDDGAPSGQQIRCAHQ
jgi:hypothetical protein